MRVLNDMFSKHTELPEELKKNPGTLFLLAGYSWADARFKIWDFHYDGFTKRFIHRSITSSPIDDPKRAFVFKGDYEKEAKERLYQLLRINGTFQSGSLDMEPLDVLKEFILSGCYRSVGGNPQLVKVYRALKVVPFVISWNGERSYFGRSLLHYEEPDRYPTMTID